MNIDKAYIDNVLDQIKYEKIKEVKKSDIAMLRSLYEESEIIKNFRNLIKFNNYCLIDGLNFAYNYEKSNLCSEHTAKNFNLDFNPMLYCQKVEPGKLKYIPKKIGGKRASRKKKSQKVPPKVSPKVSPKISPKVSPIMEKSKKIFIHQEREKKIEFTIKFFTDISKLYKNIFFLLILPNKNVTKLFQLDKINNNFTIIYLIEKEGKLMGELDDLFLVILAKILHDHNKQFCIISKDKYDWKPDDWTFISDKKCIFIRNKKDGLYKDRRPFECIACELKSTNKKILDNQIAKTKPAKRNDEGFCIIL